MIILTNARIIAPHSGAAMQNGLVVVQDGRIAGVHQRLDIPADAEVIDAGGLYLSPGFIDIHVHGGGGYNFMTADPAGIAAAAAAHARRGTTSMLPTTMAAPLTDVYRAIAAINQAKDLCSDCHILGVHLEGPFLSAAQSGAQAVDTLRAPADCDLDNLMARLDGVRIMGAAPELPGGLELGRRLAGQGILPSVAHSNATFAEVSAAIEAGYRDVTHLYSGCSTVVRKNAYRVAGVVEAGLYFDELTVQVIADLRHLPADLLRLIYKCKGPDRISVISDGLDYTAADLAEGTVYRQSNGLSVLYEDGVMKLPDRQAFAGSVTAVGQMVRHLHCAVGLPLPEVVAMAALTPARCAGASQKGRIAPGCDADILLFDEDISIKLVMTGGRIIRQELSATAMEGDAPCAP